MWSCERKIHWHLRIFIHNVYSAYFIPVEKKCNVHTPHSIHAAPYREYHTYRPAPSMRLILSRMPGSLGEDKADIFSSKTILNLTIKIELHINIYTCMCECECVYSISAFINLSFSCITHAAHRHVINIFRYISIHSFEIDGMTQWSMVMG